MQEMQEMQIGSLPGSVRSPGVGNGTPLQYSGQKDGETTETVTDFIFGGSKITADG